jgi:hypothetical protein
MASSTGQERIRKSIFDVDYAFTCMTNLFFEALMTAKNNPSQLLPPRETAANATHPLSSEFPASCSPSRWHYV